MYTPSCIFTCRRYLPLDVITQSHDEWLYIFVLFQFQPLKILYITTCVTDEALAETFYFGYQ